MFFMIWDSLDLLKEIVINFATGKKYELPFTVNKNNIKCLDYDMDSVSFVKLNNQKIYYEPIHPDVKLDIEVYENL